MSRRLRSGNYYEQIEPNLIAATTRKRLRHKEPATPLGILMGLPLEIREMIYGEVLNGLLITAWMTPNREVGERVRSQTKREIRREYAIKGSRLIRTGLPAICVTSKTISLEAEKMSGRIITAKNHTYYVAFYQRYAIPPSFHVRSLHGLVRNIEFEIDLKQTSDVFTFHPRFRGHSPYNFVINPFDDPDLTGSQSARCDKLAKITAYWRAPSSFPLDDLADRSFQRGFSFLGNFDRVEITLFATGQEDQRILREESDWPQRKVLKLWQPYLGPPTNSHPLRDGIFENRSMSLFFTPRAWKISQEKAQKDNASAIGQEVFTTAIDKKVGTAIGS